MKVIVSVAQLLLLLALMNIIFSVDVVFAFLIALVMYLVVCYTAYCSIREVEPNVAFWKYFIPLRSEYILLSRITNNKALACGMCALWGLALIILAVFVLAQ
jgi:ABC-type iron transport system FetAB permease component